MEAFGAQCVRWILFFFEPSSRHGNLNDSISKVVEGTLTSMRKEKSIKKKD